MGNSVGKTKRMVKTKLTHSGMREIQFLTDMHAHKQPGSFLKALLMSLDIRIQNGSNFQYWVKSSRHLISILQNNVCERLFCSTKDSFDPASQECNRIANEIKQTLGIKGFVFNLPESGLLASGLPACWDAVRSCLETPELEDAAALIVAEASSFADGLGETSDKSSLRLSQDEAYHLQAGLDFYHFLLPKMLVLTSVLRLACDKSLLKRGIVLDPVVEKQAAGGDGLHALFHNIRGILSLSHAQGAVPLPRAWSKYLTAASAHLNPIVHGANYTRASDQLYKTSRQLAPSLQDRICFAEFTSVEAIAKQVHELECLLPPLIMSITLLELYFRPSRSYTFVRPEPLRRIPQTDPEMAPERLVWTQPVIRLSTGASCPD